MSKKQTDAERPYLILWASTSHLTFVRIDAAWKYGRQIEVD